MYTKCCRCDGTGNYLDGVCSTCQGSGVVYIDESEANKCILKAAKEVK